MNNIILLILLILSQVLGDIWLSRGMKDFGEVNTFNLSVFSRLAIYLLTSPWIWLGVAFLVASLVIYLIAVSRLDLSYVLPLHASSYVFNALLAWLILGENIPFQRWISTILIALGVLFVGFSEGISSKNNSKKTKKAKNDINNILLFLLPFSLSKSWLFIILISGADAAGDLFLAMGMKEMGKFQLKRVVTNPLILSGVLCQATAFVAFISVLTWADISFVRPATALTYVLSLLGAKFILKENIVKSRLLGIILIGIGILFHS